MKRINTLSGVISLLWALLVVSPLYATPRVLISSHWLTASLVSAEDQRTVVTSRVSPNIYSRQVVADALGRVKRTNVDLNADGGWEETIDVIEISWIGQRAFKPMYFRLCSLSPVVFFSPLLRKHHKTSSDDQFRRCSYFSPDNKTVGKQRSALVALRGAGNTELAFRGEEGASWSLVVDEQVHGQPLTVDLSEGLQQLTIKHEVWGENPQGFHPGGGGSGASSSGDDGFSSGGYSGPGDTLGKPRGGSVPASLVQQVLVWYLGLQEEGLHDPDVHRQQPVIAVAGQQFYRIRVRLIDGSDYYLDVSEADLQLILNSQFVHDESYWLQLAMGKMDSGAVLSLYLESLKKQLSSMPWSLVDIRDFLGVENGARIDVAQKGDSANGSSEPPSDKNTPPGQRRGQQNNSADSMWRGRTSANQPSRSPQGGGNYNGAQHSDGKEVAPDPVSPTRIWNNGADPLTTDNIAFLLDHLRLVSNERRHDEAVRMTEALLSGILNTSGRDLLRQRVNRLNSQITSGSQLHRVWRRLWHSSLAEKTVRLLNYGMQTQLVQELLDCTTNPLVKGYRDKVRFRRVRNTVSFSGGLWQVHNTEGGSQPVVMSNLSQDSNFQHINTLFQPSGLGLGSNLSELTLSAVPVEMEYLFPTVDAEFAGRYSIFSSRSARISTQSSTEQQFHDVLRLLKLDKAALVRLIQFLSQDANIKNLLEALVKNGLLRGVCDSCDLTYRQLTELSKINVTQLADNNIIVSLQVPIHALNVAQAIVKLQEPISVSVQMLLSPGDGQNMSLTASRVLLDLQALEPEAYSRRVVDAIRGIQTVDLSKMRTLIAALEASNSENADLAALYIKKIYQHTYRTAKNPSVERIGDTRAYSVFFNNQQANISALLISILKRLQAFYASNALTEIESADWLWPFVQKLEAIRLPIFAHRTIEMKTKQHKASIRKALKTNAGKLRDRVVEHRKLVDRISDNLFLYQESQRQFTKSGRRDIDETEQLLMATRSLLNRLDKYKKQLITDQGFLAYIKPFYLDLLYAEVIAYTAHIYLGSMQYLQNPSAYMRGKQALLVYPLNTGLIPVVSKAEPAVVQLPEPDAEEENDEQNVMFWESLGIQGPSQGDAIARPLPNPERSFAVSQPELAVNTQPYDCDPGRAESCGDFLADQHHYYKPALRTDQAWKSTEMSGLQLLPTDTRYRFRDFAEPQNEPQYQPVPVARQNNNQFHGAQSQGHSQPHSKPQSQPLSSYPHLASQDLVTSQQGKAFQYGLRGRLSSQPDQRHEAYGSHYKAASQQVRSAVSEMHIPGALKGKSRQQRTYTRAESADVLQPVNGQYMQGSQQYLRRKIGTDKAQNPTLTDRWQSLPVSDARQALIQNLERTHEAYGFEVFSEQLFDAFDKFGISVQDISLALNGESDLSNESRYLAVLLYNEIKEFGTTPESVVNSLYAKYPHAINYWSKTYLQPIRYESEQRLSRREYNPQSSEYQYHREGQIDCPFLDAHEVQDALVNALRKGRRQENFEKLSHQLATIMQRFQLPESGLAAALGLHGGRAVSGQAYINMILLKQLVMDRKSAHETTLRLYQVFPNLLNAWYQTYVQEECTRV